MVRTESRVRSVSYVAQSIHDPDPPDLIVRSRGGRKTLELEIEGKRITVRLDELKAAIRSCE